MVTDVNFQVHEIRGGRERVPLPEDVARKMKLWREGLVEVIQGYVHEPSFDWRCRPIPRTWMCWLNLRPLFGVSGGWSIHSPLKLRGV